MLFEDTFRGKWHGYRPSLLGKKLLDHVLFIVWSLFVSSNIQCEWSGRSKHHPQQWCSVRPIQTRKSLMNHLAHDNGKALNLIKIPFYLSSIDWLIAGAWSASENIGLETLYFFPKSWIMIPCCVYLWRQFFRDGIDRWINYSFHFFYKPNGLDYKHSDETLFLDIVYRNKFNEVIESEIEATCMARLQHVSTLVCVFF